ncbi:MAG: 3-oxoacyl-[acyl-carrier-protein] reductase [Clostridium sp.]|uniref:3-oxoacyl-[acyl-carrier-protein] reductase n=1 Tax=Clostridium sp. TaxID=1506 RepID=UPI002913C3D4|nr:3-oxoacyl-[acyl-carrier-protein] reductase [Clostridium sp.]MDU7337081.1 3-oxoacyl-[acyl-carrier-protein] reductase [Clostridium sp.]
MNQTIRTAIVTGGSRGIGRAVCKKFASEGKNIVINYAGNLQAAEETAAECRELGAEAILVQADVSSAAGCEEIFAKAQESFKSIDILVNNAGITRDGLILRMSEENFDDVINTNLKGAFLCMKLASRIMMKQRWGRIINLSSVAGVRGNAGQINYSASKAGLIGMTKSLAKELAGRSVTVNAVAPGLIETDMTGVLPDAVKEQLVQGIPMARAGKPEEIAAAIAFFASEEAAYITGQVLCVDGGMAV